ncbi:MAG: IgGFc-binding protein [Deltaproteobacteria bacterium]|nr:IgGFc-binding protein [Deltaproteobacteria bacterium]
MHSKFKLSVLVFISALTYMGCTESNDRGTAPVDTATGSDVVNGTDPGDTSINGSDSNVINGSDSDTDTDKPLTCAMAKENKTYMGCDFWPTITYNMVWYNPAASTGFEFAVVVANDNVSDAVINIDGGALSASIEETIPPGELKAITLPWVQELKGPTFNTANTGGNRVTSSVFKQGGAYHMTSSVPVTAWQFSPLEYEVSPVPAGCIDNLTDSKHCYSVTNDASLLMPSTAMTGAYRVFSYGGSYPDSFGDAPGAIAITATEDNTLVKVQLSDAIAAGTGVAAADAGAVVEYTLNAGDVVQLLGKPGQWMGEPHGDLTGSLVLALDANDEGTSDSPNYKPVQVIGLSPIADLTPATVVSYADHMEEAIMPAEALGSKYIVAPPTGKGGSPVEHRVRIIGNVDGTTLTYEGTAPPGAPSSLDSGKWAEVITTSPFIVSSQDEDHPFIVVSFIQGDEPGVTMEVTPQQFRDSYTFLAPVSYETNYCDILIPDGATVTLDGAPVGGSNTAIGGGWSIQRVQLTGGPGGDGKHKLTADQPVGLQVMGYGWATSYYYPGGLNLEIISKPPVISID